VRVVEHQVEPGRNSLHRSSQSVPGVGASNLRSLHCVESHGHIVWKMPATCQPASATESGDLHGIAESQNSERSSVEAPHTASMVDHTPMCLLDFDGFHDLPRHNGRLCTVSAALVMDSMVKGWKSSSDDDVIGGDRLREMHLGLRLPCALSGRLAGGT